MHISAIAIYAVLIVIFLRLLWAAAYYYKRLGGDTLLEVSGIKQPLTFVSAKNYKKIYIFIDYTINRNSLLNAFETFPAVINGPKNFEVGFLLSENSLSGGFYFKSSYTSGLLSNKARVIGSFMRTIKDVPTGNYQVFFPKTLPETVTVNKIKFQGH
jgi:hypothetical protein